MKDRFKFRAKRLDNNEWYYGSYLYLHNADKFDWNGTRHSTNEDVHYIIDEKDVNYAIDEKTLGLCTGLRDKHNNLIYEGDVLKEVYETGEGDTDIDITEVVYRDDLAGFVLSHIGLDDDVLFSDADLSNIEVIGNIYENKELLESEE